MRKKISKVIIISLISILAINGLSTNAQSNISEVKNEASNIEWWEDARFGIFIHWGPNSILQLGHGGWRRATYMNGEKGINKYTEEIPESIKDGSYLNYKNGHNVPIEIYDNLPHLFNPSGFDAEKYVKMAKDAGAGYIVFTAKHMDGFAMFDSKETDYSIMNTSYGKDICKQLADACHKYEMPLMWYYCIWDIGQPSFDKNNPKPYNDFMAAQITELLTNYGKIQGMWWDSGGPKRIKVDYRRMDSIVNSLQPDILQNNRMQGNPGDFITPEQRIGTYNLNRSWESCQNMQVEGWFWRGRNELKTVNTCLNMLINCSAGDGNLLLDFGPRPDGRIDPPIKNQYIEMGKWLEDYGEAIYGTTGGPYKPGVWGGSTRKGNKIYLFITAQLDEGELTLPPLGKKVLTYRGLTGEKPVLLQDSEGLKIKFSNNIYQRPAAIIEMEIDDNVMEIASIETMTKKTLATNKTITSSSEMDQQPVASILAYNINISEKIYEEGENVNQTKIDESTHKEVKLNAHLKEIASSNWIRRHRGTRYRYWSSEANDKSPWIVVDFGKDIEFTWTAIKEKESRVRDFELQYYFKNEWITYFEGEIIDIFQLHHRKIHTDKVRLIIKNAETTPIRIHTIDFY